MVLNALRVDPGPVRRTWQNSSWRWFDEKVLDLGCSSKGQACCLGKTLAQIATDGVTLDEVIHCIERSCYFQGPLIFTGSSNMGRTNSVSQACRNQRRGVDDYTPERNNRGMLSPGAAAGGLDRNWAAHGCLLRKADFDADGCWSLQPSCRLSYGD